MLEPFFTRMARQANIEIDETLDSLRLSATEQTDFQLLIQLFEELKTISPRDRFELIVEIGGNDMAISGCLVTDRGNLESHIEKYNDNEDYDFTLTINKLVERKTCSIYFLSIFSLYIEKQSICNLFSIFSSRLDGVVYFEVFSSIETFGSKSIIFFDASNSLEAMVDIESVTFRDEKIEEIRDNSSLTNCPKNLLPEDFLLQSPSTFSGINDSFSRLNSVLALIFIASASEVHMDGRLSYKIFGYKCLSYDNVDIDGLTRFQPFLYPIYDWAFSGGSRSDKLGLIRNILSIHLDDNGNPLFDSDVLDAIKSSYQIYLKDNVNSYLETKNKIGEIIIESIAKTSAMADELAQSFKSNIFLFMTFILSIVVVNGLEKNGGNVIFSGVYLFIVSVLCFFSFLWLKILYCGILKRFHTFSDASNDFLKLNYERIIMPSEVTKITSEVKEKNLHNLKAQLDDYTCWWKLLIFLFFLTFLIGYLLFSTDTTDDLDIAVRSYQENKVDNQKPYLVKKIGRRDQPEDKAVVTP